MATRQVIFGGCDVTPTVSATRYGGLMANGFSASEPSQSGICSTGGVLTNWQVQVNTAPAAGKSWLFTVRVNGADTALAVTIADANTVSSVDTSEVAIAAGDLIGFSSVPTGTPTDAASIKWSCDFIPTTAGHTLMLSSSSGTNLADAQFVSIACPKSPDSVEGDAQVIFPTAGKLKNFYVNLATAPGSGNTRTFTVRLNGTTTGQISLAIANTATTGNETATELTVAAGDSVAILDTDSVTPAATAARFGITFIPDNAGEFIACATTDDNLNGAATEFQYVSCADSTLSATEADFECLSVTAFTVKKLYAKLSVDPGTSPDAYTFTLKKNGSDTALLVTIVADNTTGNATQDVSVSAADLIYYSIAPVSTPSATPHTQLGLLCYIAPTGGDVNVALTGISSTVSAGSIVPSMSIPMTGISSTGSAGSMTVSSTLPISGSSSTLSAGSLSPNLSVSASGLETTLSAGSLTPSLSVPVTGISSTVGIGTLIPSITISISGNSITVSVGTVTASGGNSATGQGLIYFIMGGGILGSYDFLNHLLRDSNAFFMTPVNVDSPTKVTASTTAANANFMEE